MKRVGIAVLVVAGVSAMLAADPQSFATLPQATASFGPIASDGRLYVYRGHISPTHNYYVGAVSGRFDPLRLTGEPVWEELREPRTWKLGFRFHFGKS